MVALGDGTTSVVVIAGALLDCCRDLLNKGIHPTTIAESFLLATQESERLLEKIAIPVDLADREALIHAATTSLASKVVGSDAEILAPLAVDATLKVIETFDMTDGMDGKEVSGQLSENFKSNMYSSANNEYYCEQNVDINSNIRVVKQMGGTVEDTEIVDGLVFAKGQQVVANNFKTGPSSVNNAKIGMIQFCLSAPKTDIENNVVISEYAQMDRLLREERKYILKMCKKIKATGCNVLLIQKSILRDATNELSLHFLAKMKILVVTDIERRDVEFICRTTGCQPVAHVDSFTEERLGFAELVEQVNMGAESVIKVTGCQPKAADGSTGEPSKTVSVLVRGSNRLVLDEAERSLHDAFCVVRCLVKKKYLIVGGGCPETHLALELSRYANTIVGEAQFCIRAFAEALEVVPFTLAQNAGLDGVEMVTELRRKHREGFTKSGINVKKGCIADDLGEEKVLQPLLVTLSAIALASETVRMILKIDDMIGSM